MDASTADDRPNQLPAYSGPPPPTMHRPGPPHNFSPAHPPPYDRSWPPYPPSFEGHAAVDPRPYAHPPPLHPGPGYNPSRQLPHPDASYARQNSLPTVAHTMGTPPIPSIAPMNGVPPDYTPQSAPADYRNRKPFPSPEQHTNGEAPPPISVPHTQYSSPASHFPPTPAYDFYLNQTGAKRKPGRAQQACDQCRSRKAKCDEGRPSCGHCRENNFTCVYKEIPPHKQERSTQLILDRLDQMQSVIDRMEQAQQSILTMLSREPRQLDEVPTEVGGLERLGAPTLKAGSNAVSSESPSATHSQRTNMTLKFEEEAQLTTVPSNTPAGHNGQVKDEVKQPAVVQQGANPPPVAQPGVKDKDSLQDADVSQVISAIPVEHSTAAHKLLGWRWVKHLLLPDKYDEDYVMTLEEDRGLIRVYGLGEGDDASESVETELPRIGWSEQHPPHSASPRSHYSPDIPPIGPPGLDVTSGIMTTDPETVRRYYRSYLENMYRLHPFFIKDDLARKIETFIKTYCTPNDPIVSPPIASADTEDLPRGAKRKRPGDGSLGPWRVANPPPNRRRVKRTMDNSIVLLVLAVGSICECRESIRLPQDPAETGLLSSRGGPQGRSLINLDVIPGLAYYAYATDILGNLQGGVRVTHVQSALLAGIYAGQLAHPFQSHGWIYQASRACQVLNRAKRFDHMEAGPLKDLYCCISWSCFQLESDIRAELDLPDSGIPNIDGRIGLPSSPPGLHGEDSIMWLYSCQVHLRKVLNRIHGSLYKDSIPHSGGLMRAMIEGLNFWRGGLPEALQWKDGDKPAEDINIARLRAKYYGGYYIVHRPVLYHCLERFDPNEKDASNLRRSSSGREGPLSRPKESALAKLPANLREACKVCIDSAIFSTLAFDGVKGGRPVVTNIFGTGHAQFGNMLVLAATYISPLGELVKRDLLESLFRRTISFLDQSRDISPTLRKDAEILRKCYAKIFHEELAATSFASQSSDQTMVT